MSEEKARIDRREQIIEAALALSDELGADGLSMRLIAERVSLSPMALYRHVANKADLLDALVGRVLAEVAVGELHGDWNSRLRIIAQQLLHAAIAHPAAFALALGRPYRAPEALAVMDAMYALLTDAGVRDRELPRVERLISTTLLGYAVAVSSAAFWSDASPDGTPMNPADERWADELAKNVDDLGALISAARAPR